jgi:putative tricarboxylic transport membrane protein
MAAFGLLLGTIGSDPMNMTPRLTFGILALGDGVNLVPLAIGLFGLSEVLFMARQTAEQMKILPAPTGVLGFLPSREEAKRSVAPVLRGTTLGFLVGLLPGGGAVLASFLSYAMERKLSKHPEEFGKGAVEGVAGPEAANNAGTAGAFVPLLCMGIPANAITALLLGAFIIHGVTPGPTILERQPQIFWGVVASMYIGNIMLLILNLPLIGLFVRILDIPRAYLTPMILAVCLIGVYSSNGNPADVVIAVIFGFVGYGLRRHGFDLGIVILAYVLGPIFERSVRQSLAISDGDPSIFLHSYLSAGFAIVAAALLIAGLWPKRKKQASS